MRDKKAGLGGMAGGLLLRAVREVLPLLGRNLME